MDSSKQYKHLRYSVVEKKQNRRSKDMNFWPWNEGYVITCPDYIEQDDPFHIRVAQINRYCKEHGHKIDDSGDRYEALDTMLDILYEIYTNARYKANLIWLTKQGIETTLAIFVAIDEDAMATNRQKVEWYERIEKQNKGLLPELV